MNESGKSIKHHTLSHLKASKIIIHPLWTGLIIFFLGWTVQSCEGEKQEFTDTRLEIPSFDLDSIKARGYIQALVDNSSTSYFLYKGRPMGFEYELLKRFSKHLDLELKIIQVENLDNIIGQFHEDKIDIIAANLTVTASRAEQLSFTHPILRSKQVLVQRRFDPLRDSADLLIESVDELMGKTITVRKNSSFYERVLNLSEEIGGEIRIDPAEGEVSVEQLIEGVSEGRIDYTIADEHVAKINKAFFSNIQHDIPISLDQKMAWAVKPEADSLLSTLNAWLVKFKKTVEFRTIYLKYFGNTVLYRKRTKSKYFTSKSGQISPYDAILKKESATINWDWRLLSALVYQESQFDPNAKSWAGAIGLMQLMPETAASYGIDSAANAEENIKAGVRYLHWLDQQFTEKVPNFNERIPFVLAAYNVGLGHVFDAIRLAEKFNLSPITWENNVAEMLLKKSQASFYKDEAVYYGYCRGSEPYQYVKDIMNRFSDYKNITSNISP